MDIKQDINSTLPSSIGSFKDLVPGEMMYYLYYPIKLAGDIGLDKLPHNLEWLKPMIESVFSSVGPKIWKERYLYITCKNYFVEPNSYGNRPGWHGDGFGTTDLNYIWCNASPTEFCVQKFCASLDDAQSLLDYEEQALEENVQAVEVGNLYVIDPSHIHRVALNKKGGMRCFVKLSLSEHKFNLAGNSINPNLSSDWTLYERSEIRNMESYGSGGDFLFLAEGEHSD